MIKKIELIVVSFIVFMCFSNCYAYTKNDVINLASSINTCSSDTASIVSGFKVTYTRMLNERDVSSSNLNQMYNNISKVKDILTTYSVCSKDSLSSLPSSIKDELYSLYKQTNKLITSSPRYVDIADNKENKDTEIKKQSSSNGEVQMVIDSSNGEIKIYEDGTLINVVGNYDKLNYVGINKIIIGIILIFIAILIFMIILKIKGNKSIFITSITYTCIFIIAFTIVFKDNISSYLDILSNMSINVSDKEKTIKVKNKKIISYPSYNSKYATIYIDNKKEDIYFGDSSEVLSKGIGHMPTTNLPGEGGRVVLSGHNTGLFKKLFDLNKDDEVTIETIYGKFIYKFKDSEVVDESSVESLEKDYDLIVYTCYPNTSIYGNKRLVVYLNLVGSEWLGDMNES